MIFNSFSVSSNIEHQKAILIETSISDKGLPTFEIYGMISKSVEESKRRVVTAFESLGCSFPLKNIKVNLSPAEILKEGTHYDFAIAASILSFTHNYQILNTDMFIGEISFDGSLRPVNNIFYLILVAKELGFKRIFIPIANVKDINLVSDIEIIGLNNILDILNTHINQVHGTQKTQDSGHIQDPLFLKIVENRYSKRVLALALAGKHNLLMEGFPGVGKSMLAKSAKDLLPDLSEDSAVYTQKLLSYLGQTRQGYDVYRPPFRSPHSSSSYSAIFGSFGNKIYPGEVALSHNGILFLDEIPEFNRLVIEGLRSPLEDKVISISRTRGKFSFPCDFVLIASSNPCKCGYFNHSKIQCKCQPYEVMKYQNKLSGPIKDRIDIIYKFNSDSSLYLNNEENTYSYNEFLELKEKIKKVSNECLSILLFDNSTKDKNKISTNIFTHLNLSKDVSTFITNAQEKYSISPRKIFKILKLSKTISLFRDSEKVSIEDLLEAVNLSGVRS